MPSARSSQIRPTITSSGPGNVRAAGTKAALDVPQHGYHRPIRFQPEPVVPRAQHLTGRAPWRQLEDNHIRLGHAHGVKTVGTTDLKGPARKYYQAELGIGTKGQTLLYRPDVILHAGWDPTKWILVEDKWQNDGGSCEAKVFEVWWNLHQAMTYDSRVVGAYLILDGPGWSEKNTERFKLMLSTMPATVRVFFSDEEFLAHGIPEAWTDPAQPAASRRLQSVGDPMHPQLRLA